MKLHVRCLRFACRSLWLLGLAAWGVGCLSTPSGPEGPDGPLPAADAMVAAPAAAHPVARCDWRALSRSGREAIRDGRLGDADRRLAAALACSETLPTRDPRHRATLGNLVHLAATYHREGRLQAAGRLRGVVRSRIAALGWHPSTAEDYDQRFWRIARPSRVPPRPPPKVGAGRRRAPRHHGFDGLIRETAEAFAVDPALVKAVIAAESNFESKAVSRAGAMGLMQLMPQTAKEMGVEDPFRPTENVAGGVRYLRAMLDRYGDERWALAAYNAGPDAVEQYGGIPPYPETRRYVRRVLRYYADYRWERID